MHISQKTPLRFCFLQFPLLLLLYSPSSHIPPTLRPRALGAKKDSSKQHNGWRSKEGGRIPRTAHRLHSPFGHHKTGTPQWEGCQAARREGKRRDRQERRAVIIPSTPSSRGPEPTAGRAPPTTLVFSPTWSVVQQSLPSVRRSGQGADPAGMLGPGEGLAPQGGHGAGWGGFLGAERLGR